MKNNVSILDHSFHLQESHLAEVLGKYGANGRKKMDFDFFVNILLYCLSFSSPS